MRHPIASNVVGAFLRAVSADSDGFRILSLPLPCPLLLIRSGKQSVGYSVAISVAPRASGANCYWRNHESKALGCLGGSLTGRLGFIPARTAPGQPYSFRK